MPDCMSRVYRLLRIRRYSEHTELAGNAAHENKKN
ncbi:Histone H2A, partial [Trichinella spiralis]